MTWHSRPSPAAAAPGAYHALGAGLGSWLIHMFIWRMIWRLGLAIWRIPTFGPVILGLIVIAVIGLGVMRSRRGLRWPRRNRGGVYGYGSGSGPRDF